MKLIPYSDACAAIAAACAPVPEECLPVRQALGAAASRPATAACASPAFNNAAMDGYALSAGDTANATEDSPVELLVAGDLRVGASPQAAQPLSGRAYRVATGALTPAPLDTVVPLERSAVIEHSGSRLLRFAEPVERGRNLRIMGEEFPVGAAFDFTCERLGAGHIALLCAAGIGELHARRPPPLALLTTGDEVRPAGVPLAPGEIANVNAAWLAAWCSERRLTVAHSGHVRDDPAALAREFQNARESGARLLVSSGSASAGKHDILRAALAELDARIVFHGVAMRPGKPALFALLPDGTPIFGLPGNPLATAAGMRFLVWPALRATLAMPPEASRPLPLADPCNLRENYTHFLLAHHENSSGAATLVNPQRPAQPSALATAHLWLRLEGGHHPRGTPARSYSL